MSSRIELSKWIVSILVATLALTGCAEILSGLELDPADSATPEDGLREALRVGTQRAVDAVGRAGGYLDNGDVRIPVPDKLDTLAQALRALGAGDQIDEFVTSMNRAAEAAAPVAKQVFLDTVRQMSFADAVTILRGDAHEATDYFQEHAGPELTRQFRPIVSDKLDGVGATRAFNDLMRRTEELPLVRKPTFDLTEYVTGEALDGLFLMLAREEERIRRDPRARTTALLRKFFGEGA